MSSRHRRPRSPALDGIHELVGLLDQVLHERLVGLLAVPRAASGCPQALEHGDEFFEFGMRWRAPCHQHAARSTHEPAPGYPRGHGDRDRRGGRARDLGDRSFGLLERAGQPGRDRAQRVGGRRRRDPGRGDRRDDRVRARRGHALPHRRTQGAPARRRHSEIGDDPECYGDEATALLRSLLPEGTQVRVLADAQPLDQYDRSLLLLWLRPDGRHHLRQSRPHRAGRRRGRRAGAQPAATPPSSKPQRMPRRPPTSDSGAPADSRRCPLLDAIASRRQRAARRGLRHDVAVAVRVLGLDRRLRHRERGDPAGRAPPRRPR